jgi:dephospho-CoA kinase
MKNSPLKIAVTGGIGSGKSYVCELLRRRGFPVFDCDREAKVVMTEDDSVRRRIQALVPDAFLTDGSLNKPAMATYLFADETHASNINHVVHPAVAERFRRWCKEQNTTVAFMECAILYESHFDALVDKVLLVDAPDALRLERATKRDGVSADKIRERMARQYPMEVLRKCADYTLLNNVNSNPEVLLEHFLQAIGI